MASEQGPCPNCGQTVIKKLPLSSYLQSVAKRLLGNVPMSNFTSIIGQAGNLLQTNEGKNNFFCFIYKMYIFKKLVFKFTS